MLYSPLLLLTCSALTWPTISSKYYRGSAFEVSEGRFEVPLDYGKDSSNLSLYARRFKRGKPEKIVLLIPGGPGQSGRAYDGEVKHFEQFKDVWIYTLDHRGTGKSGKLARGNKCMANPAECVDPQILKHYSAHNAAHDLVSWADWLRKEHQSAEIYAVASSYGTHLLHRAMVERGDLFKGVLLVDFYPTFKIQNADLSENIISACHRDKQCKEIWPSVSHLHQVMLDVSNPGRNACSKHLRAIPDFQSIDDFTSLIQFIMHNTLVVSLPFPKHPLVVALAFLKHLHTCVDLPAFQLITQRLVERYYEKGRLLRRESAKGHLNSLINAYIGYSEAHQQDLKACRRKELPLSECTMIDIFLQHYQKAFQPVAYTPQPFDIITVNTTARVIVVGGALDPQTPISTSRHAFDLINATDKQFLQFDYGLHGSSTACSKSIYASLLDPKISADSCIMAQNQRSIDWNYTKSYMNSHDKLNVKRYLIITLVVLSIVIVIGVCLYFRR